MPRRALFVDYDGVLHPAPPSTRLLVDPATRAGYYEAIRDLSARHFCWLPVLVELLLPHPDVAVSVHSSWRLGSSRDAVLGHLAQLAPGGRLLDVTNGDGRYLSILDAVARLGIGDYRILDDEPRYYPAGCSELVICPPSEGISSPAVQNVLRSWLETARAD